MKGVTNDMGIKIAMLVVFFAVMVGIGMYCRRHATDVKGSSWADAMSVHG